MRTKLENQVEQFIQESTPELEAAGQAISQLAAIEAHISENVIAIAKQVSYDGPLTVGGLEDGIRFYQRRTAEACIELGKRMLLLKELTPHGEFLERLTLLGFSKSTAYRFMQLARKFSKLPRLGSFNANQENTSKMLELLILDDDEIEELGQEGSVLGITFEAIDLMSASELKKALRESQELAKAKDDVIKAKSEELNKKQERLALLENTSRTAHIDWPEAFKGYVEQLAIVRKNIKHNMGALDVVRAEAMKIEPASEAEEASLNQAREILATELIGIHNECLEMVQALGMQFDRTLGAYSDARIALLDQ